MAKVNPLPQGIRSVTPELTLKGCAEAIELYKKAFGAEEVTRAMDPSGKLIWHAMIRIGDSAIFLTDEIPGMSTAMPSQLWIYRDEIDAMFNKAVSAGMTVMMPMSDAFWGDRFGKVKDKFGVEWSLGQHIKDLTPEQIKEAEKAFVATMKKG